MSNTAKFLCDGWWKLYFGGCYLFTIQSATMEKSEDQEWIEYCQKIRIEERNKVVNECIKVVKKRAYAMVFIKELEALKITTSNPEQS